MSSPSAPNTEFNFEATNSLEWGDKIGLDTEVRKGAMQYNAQAVLARVACLAEAAACEDSGLHEKLVGVPTCFPFIFLRPVLHGRWVIVSISSTRLPLLCARMGA